MTEMIMGERQFFIIGPEWCSLWSVNKTLNKNLNKANWINVKSQSFPFVEQLLYHFFETESPVSRKGGFENMESDREKGECCWIEMLFIGTWWSWGLSEELLEYRFSAFWLRSKCSICSYQLNIWYESHVLSSILNWFLSGERVQELAPTLSRVVLALQYRQDRPTIPNNLIFVG